MTVSYEWDVEEVATDEHADILEHWFQTSYADCVRHAAKPPAEGARWDIVLVRDDDEQRTWAYVVDGKLPQHFENAFGHEATAVPKRFHKEVGA